MERSENLVGNTGYDLSRILKTYSSDIIQVIEDEFASLLGFDMRRTQLVFLDTL